MAYKSPVYIVLNGPSEVGKSTEIASGLCNRLKLLEYKVVGESMANPMKHFIAVALGMKYSDLKKNSPMAVLQGYSPREFLIDLSESYLKKRYQDDFFGRLLEHRILRIDPLPDFVVIDDVGFHEEVHTLGYTLRIIRVTRPGKTFQGDSRNFLSDPHYTLDNDGTLEDLALKLDHLCSWCDHEFRVIRGIVPSDTDANRF